MADISMNAGRTPLWSQILFKGAMINAISEARSDYKTQTRRLVDYEGIVDVVDRAAFVAGSPHPLSTKPTPSTPYVLLDDGEVVGLRSPYGAIGDFLWVRETLRRRPNGKWVYAADGAEVSLPPEHPDAAKMISWAHHKKGDVCVSIHMPRWASRVSLKITGIRIERLHSISDTDALAEGIRRFYSGEKVAGYGIMEEGCGFGEPGSWVFPLTAAEAYRRLWERINGADSWPANPWVWVITFKKLEGIANE